MTNRQKPSNSRRRSPKKKGVEKRLLQNYSYGFVRHASGSVKNDVITGNYERVYYFMVALNRAKEKCLNMENSFTSYQQNHSDLENYGICKHFLKSTKTSFKAS